MTEQVEEKEPLFQFEATADTSVEDEVVLHFKRFPQEKQDQVRALVNYATLMGLNGKDLVSIGGKLDRVKVKQEIDRNRDIIRSMAIRPIGKDRNCNSRWAYESNGFLYHFDRQSYYDIRITNVTTKKTTTAQHGYASGWKQQHQVGRWSWLMNSYLPEIMLGVYYGDIKLP